MLAATLEAEVNQYIAELTAERDDAGRRLAVRNGHHRLRTVTTAAGASRGHGAAGEPLIALADGAARVGRVVGRSAAGLHARVAGELRPAPPCRGGSRARGRGRAGHRGRCSRREHARAPTGVWLYLQRSRVVFTGDTVAEHQGAIILGPFNLDRDRAAVSFRAIADLDSEVACLGHGRPVVGDASGTIRAASKDLIML